MEVDSRWRLVALFCYILCLHSFAIFFFTSGFLLTRSELPEFSACSDIAKAPCSGGAVRSRDPGFRETVVRKCDNVVEGKAFCAQDETILEPVDDKLVLTSVMLANTKKIEDDGGSKDKLSTECWTKPAIKRAVIIIIDALRFDFVAPSSSFSGEIQPWMDKLQVMQQLSKEENGPARIFKFVADPPTTTLQRLKGLTTGGLPTFVDIGHSFGAPAIVEDNLIYQLVRAGKKVRMMGDDTWMKLFPNHFSVAHPFDSFNVKDLHTVDDGVIREIFPALLESDWNVLIAHFLGVDHVGHIFGVESPLMVEKLEQYNRVIEDVVAVLKNQSGPGGLHEDTMLLVLGDHGQTLNGDHGGGTSEEVETALFALSMRELPGHLPQDLQSSACVTSTGVKADRSQCITTLPQLDFASTMAALLGVPFPYGSVGRVNSELYALAASTWPIPSDDERLPEALVRAWLERYNHVLCINSWQVKRYLDAYTASSIRGFPSADLAHVQSLYERAQKISHSLQTDDAHLKSENLELDFSKFKEYSNETVTSLIDSIQGNLAHLLAAANLARTQWTQFEDEWMAFGLILLIISLLIHAVALTRAMKLTHTVLSEDKDSDVQLRIYGLFPLKRMFLTCGGAAVTAGAIWGFQVTTRWTKSSPAAALSNGQTNTIFAAVILMASVVAYVMPIFGVGKVRRDKSISENGQTIGAGSRDQRAKSYLAVLFVGLHACGLLSNSFILGEGRVVCFLLATSGILYLREALQRSCKVPQAILFLILNAGMASVGLFEIFKDSATVASSSFKNDYVPASLASQQFVTLACVAVATTVLPVFSLAWLIIRGARTIFTSQSLYLATVVTVPLCYFLVVIHWFTMDLVSSRVLEIPQSFKEFSRLLCPQLVYLVSLMLLLFTIVEMTLNSGGNVQTSYRNHVVEGILSMLAGVSGTIILLLGRKGPTIVLLAVLEAWCLLDLQGLEDSNRNPVEADKALIHRVEHSLGRSLGSYFAAAVDWNLVAVQLFFCTGHRCTFDGLHYTAAFIGFDEFYFYRQGVLLAADTFGSSHILPAVGLPLLITAAAVETSPESKLSHTEDSFFSLEVAKVYLCYGLVRTILTAVTTVCVTLQRRHLMVWGLFAPKYVFDALGLLVVDGFIVVATTFYFTFFSRKIRLNKNE